MNTDLDRIWLGDEFGRQAEAKNLEAYIRSVAVSKVRLDEGRAFTLAVDAPYGVGKSFFLTRLSEQLALNYPTAFVDAWADDLMDEPLTALAATLKKALAKYLAHEPLAAKWDHFLEVTGRFAVTAAIGAAKRGIGMVIGAEAAGLAANVVGALHGAAKEAIKGREEQEGQKATTDAAADLAKEAGKDFFGTPEALKKARGDTLMNDRIEMFEAGKAAVTALKESLTQVLEALPDTVNERMIVIVIDELDRCRPPYAVKLLEEIKHLFDVPGLVFIFGMNEAQLTKSLAGAYGPNFDGQKYLRRFVSRYYRLPDRALAPQLDKLLERARIPHAALVDLSASATPNPNARLFSPPILKNGRPIPPKLSHLLSIYMDAWSLTARDAISVVDALQTFLALTTGPIMVPFLLPHLMQKVAGKHEWNFSRPERRENTVPPTLDYSVFYRNGPEQDSQGRPVGQNYHDLAMYLRNIAHMSRNEISRDTATDYPKYLMIRMFLYIEDNGADLPLPLTNYFSVLESVGRFVSEDTDDGKTIGEFKP